MKEPETPTTEAYKRGFRDGSASKEKSPMSELRDRWRAMTEKLWQKSKEWGARDLQNHVTDPAAVQRIDKAITELDAAVDEVDQATA